MAMLPLEFAHIRYYCSVGVRVRVPSRELWFLDNLYDGKTPVERRCYCPVVSADCMYFRFKPIVTFTKQSVRSTPSRWPTTTYMRMLWLMQRTK